MIRRAYQTDLSDEEWAVIELHLPVLRPPGRPRVHPLREIFDAVFYTIRGGCAWRLLPHDDFPPWKRPLLVLQSLAHRRHLGAAARSPSLQDKGTPRERDPQPSAAIMDSRSVKTTGVGGEGRGYDPGKEVKGRKRHLLVDTQRLVLKAKVHAASVFDRDRIKPLTELVEDRFPRLAHLRLDAGYDGKGKGKDWAEKALVLTVEVVRPPRRWMWVREGQQPPPWPGFTICRGDRWWRGRYHGSTRTGG
jgi:putative transposase